MKSEIKRFWLNLLTKINEKINQYINKGGGSAAITDAGDDTIINFFAMVMRKVLNRALMGAEFSVVSDSAVAEPLKDLCRDINENIYKITAHMLGGHEKSECWAVPSFVTVGGKQKLVHSYLGGERVCITATRGNDEISECYMILDIVKRKNKTYFLCRRHFLDENGNLTISYFASDEFAKEIAADVPEWQNITKTEVTYPNVNHIGFGRYKSPVVPLGNDTVYGVPLNYGCGYIEKQLQDAVNMAAHEMKASKKMLFPDRSIVIEKKDGEKSLGYGIDGYIYPIQKRAGVDGNLIDEYCPEIRGSAYSEYLTDILCKYQAQMGVRDLITHTESTNGATATEIKSKNADNLALETSIRKMIRKGNMQTLEADGIYLNIPRDLWEYDEDFKDIYEDEQQTLSNNILLYDKGGISQSDLIKYWNPTFDDKKIEEKKNEINDERKANTNMSIEDMLGQ